MRTRLLYPEFAKHEKLGELSHSHRLLFAMLPMLADREGLLEDRPKRIKAELFPYDTDPDIDGWLTDLHNVGMIVRYEVEGKEYIHIPGFLRWQTPHHREQPTEFPKPCLGKARPCLGTSQPRASPVVSVSVPVSVEKPCRQVPTCVQPLLLEPPSTSATGPANEVFAHWKRVMGKDDRVRFSPERERKVKARLKDGYTVAQLCQAIDGCKASPHHQGVNDSGAKYDDLTLIFRDSSKVDQFISYTTATPSTEKQKPLGEEAAKAEADARAARELKRTQERLAEQERTAEMSRAQRDGVRSMVDDLARQLGVK